MTKTYPPHLFPYSPTSWEAFSPTSTCGMMHRIGPVGPLTGPRIAHAREMSGSLEGGVSILLAEPLLDQTQKDVAVARPGSAPAPKHLALQLGEALQQFWCV